MTADLLTLQLLAGAWMLYQTMEVFLNHPAVNAKTADISDFLLGVT